MHGTAEAEGVSDEEVDFLAANMSGAFGATSGAASAGFLTKDTDRALALLTEKLAETRARGPHRLLVMTGRERGFMHDLLARFARAFNDWMCR